MIAPFVLLPSTRRRGPSVPRDVRLRHRDLDRPPTGQHVARRDLVRDRGLLRAPRRPGAPDDVADRLAVTRAGDPEARLADGAPFARGERAEARGRLAPRRAELLDTPAGRDADDAVDAAGVRDPGEVERQRAPAGVDHPPGGGGPAARAGAPLRAWG